MNATSIQTQNNVRAGVFLIAAALLGLTVFIILSGWNPLQSRIPYHARFTIEQGVNGLASGSQVKVGGLVKGVVTGIQPQYKLGGNNDERMSSILVDFELDDDVSLWSNARVTRFLPLLGGSAWLNFDSVGGQVKQAQDTANSIRLAPGQEIQAQTSGGILATLLGPGNATRAGQALSNIDEFTQFLAGVPVTWDKQVVPMLENADALVASMHNDYGPWSESITKTLQNADDAAAKINTTMTDLPPLIASAQSDLDAFGTLLTDNAPKLGTALDDVLVMSNDGKSILAHFRAETMLQIDTLLRKGESGLDTFVNALDRIDHELVLRMPDVSMMLADLRQSAAQMKLTTLEVRRSPWKLLYTPTPDETAHENLYESARSYVLATNELESAARAFRNVFESPSATDVTPELRKQVEQYVLDALERFKTAQERLFSELIDSTPEP